MNKIIQKLVKKYSAPRKLNLGDNICLTADIFRKFKDGLKSEFFPEINETKFSKDEIQKLKNSIIKYIARFHDDNTAGLIFALCKLRDKSLKNLYIEYLNQALNSLLKHNATVLQILFALDAIGEKVFDGKSQSIELVGKNEIQAHKYLQRKGLKIPY